MKKLLLTLCSTLLLTSLFAQAKLPRAISASLDDEKAVVVSASGNTLLFLRHEPLRELWVAYYSERQGNDWSKPEEVPVLNEWHNLNQFGGFSLSADGQTMYFSTKKYGGVGWHDIWVTHKYASEKWTTPENLAKPVNSATHEVSPFLTAHGEELYFVRCAENPEEKLGTSCQIMVSKTVGKGYKDPKALPSIINSGSVNYPRLMADGKTLFFTKYEAGKHVQYMSKKDGRGGWSTPKRMDFLNTEASDPRFISMTALENIMFFIKKDNTHDIYMVKVPEEMQPSPVMHVKGRVLDRTNGKPLAVAVIARDAESGELLVYQKNDPKTGEYHLFVPEGRVVDISVQDLQREYFFFADLYDLTGLNKYKQETLDEALIPIRKGSSFIMPVIEFMPNTDMWKLGSEDDLDRLMETLKKHTDKRVELLVFQDEVIEDTVKSSNLKRVIVDSVSYTVYDTVISQKPNPGGIVDSISGDTIMVKDTMVVERQEKRARYIYHNDMTDKQAGKIEGYLQAKGVPPEKIKVKAIGDNFKKLNATQKQLIKEDDRGVLVTFY